MSPKTTPNAERPSADRLAAFAGRATTSPATLDKGRLTQASRYFVPKRRPDENAYHQRPGEAPIRLSHRHRAAATGPHRGVIIGEMPERLVAVSDQHVAALINRLHRAFDPYPARAESHTPSQNRMPAQQNYFITFDLKIGKYTSKLDGRNAIDGKAAGV